MHNCPPPRQVETYRRLVSIARKNKIRCGRRSVSVQHQALADYHGCCRETIVRDFTI